MNQSNNIANLTKALLAAHRAIDSAVFASSSNETFSSRYANLGSIIAAIKPALNAAGIVVVQSPTTAEKTGSVSLTTRLLHETGEWMEDTCTSPLTHLDPQAFGSAVSYLRRYALAAMMGLYQTDDDAESASGHHGFRTNAKVPNPAVEHNEAGAAAVTSLVARVHPDDAEQVSRWLNTIQNATLERLATARKTAQQNFKNDGSLAFIQDALDKREASLKEKEWA